MNYARSLSIGLVVLLSLAGSAGAQTPVGTAFTYQGRLEDAGAPANGTYDLRFLLYTADVGGSQVGPILVKEDVPVTAGLFAVTLDFGSTAFAGDTRWLEIAIRPGASAGAFTPLVSRQELTPTPNAIFAKAAASATTVGGLSCSTGQVPKWSGSGWACAADDNSGGDITAVTAGSGLTGGGTSGDVTLTVSGVTSAMITDGTITAADIAAGSITGTQIAPATITGTQIADGSVSGIDILDGSVGSPDIATDTILAANIAAGAVGSSEIANGAVTAAKLAPAGFADGVDDTPIHNHCTSGAKPSFGNGVWIDYLSCTINAPVAGGTVVVEANAVYYINHANGTEDYYYIGIGNAPAPDGYISVNNIVIENVVSGMPSGIYQLTRHASAFEFLTTAGTSTYYLKGFSQGGYDVGDKFNWGDLVVSWYPPRQ